MIIITFHNMLLHREDVPGNILLLAMSLFMTLVWVLGKQVRQDIREKRIRRRGIEVEKIGHTLVIL